MSAKQLPCQHPSTQSGTSAQIAIANGLHTFATRRDDGIMFFREKVGSPIFGSWSGTNSKKSCLVLDGFGDQVKVTGYMHPGYTAKDSREALCADPEFWRAALEEIENSALWVDINVHAHYRHLARYIDINIIVVCRWQQTQRLRQRLWSAMRVFACMCNVRQGRWHGVLTMPFARLA